MATEYVYICDRCKKKMDSTIFGPVKIQKRLAARVAFKTYSDCVWARLPQEWYLCKECLDALEQFMKSP